jgi:hypothetical protein
MIGTEEEAKTKACPMASGFYASNQQGAPHCIASACAAWRWLDAEYPYYNHEGGLMPARTGKMGQILAPKLKADVGYCGLFHK